MQAPPAPSAKEQYSRLCALQMSLVRNTIGSEEFHAFTKRNKSFMYSKREREHSYAEMMSASKERSYELWCKIQLDEILAKTDASSVIASSNLFGADHRKKKNAYYLCSRCGKPKKGHVCKANISGTNLNTSGSNLNGSASQHDDDDEEEEEEYKVDPDDPEYEDEEIPEDDEEEYP